MSIPISIRTYEDQDKSSILELHKRALESIGEYIQNPEWERDLHDIPSYYLNQGGSFLVAHHQNKIIAMGAFRKIDNHTAEIKRMRTHPDYQRSGIATKLLKTLEKQAADAGFKKLCLDTSTKKIQAQTFYEKNGYTKFGTGTVACFTVYLYEKMLQTTEN